MIPGMVMIPAAAIWFGVGSRAVRMAWRIRPFIACARVAPRMIRASMACRSRVMADRSVFIDRLVAFMTLPSSRPVRGMAVRATYHGWGWRPVNSPISTTMTVPVTVEAPAIPKCHHRPRRTCWRDPASRAAAVNMKASSPMVSHTEA